MSLQIALPVEDRSQVADSRRSAAQLARSLGFDVNATATAELAVTECATNILKHAGHGQLILRPLTGGTGSGLEILALDRGPGIADLALSLRDGHSTAGSAGTGLGALQRLGTDFQVYSRPGLGTVVRIELWLDKRRMPAHSLQIGAVSLLKQGEEICGDDWITHMGADYLTVMVADGLGHGPDAYRAARVAVETLAKHPDAKPHALIETAHRALASTRGAALGVARLETADGSGSFAGVGNISARVVDGLAQRQLASHNGTVGHTVRKIQEFAFPFPKDSLLILHSDGLDTHWNMDDYPGLVVRHPGLIAGVLYRDHTRGRDDSTVVVIRNRAAGASAV